MTGLFLWYLRWSLRNGYVVIRGRWIDRRKSPKDYWATMVLQSAFYLFILGILAFDVIRNLLRR